MNEIQLAPEEEVEKIVNHLNSFQEDAFSSMSIEEMSRKYRVSTSAVREVLILLEN